MKEENVNLRKADSTVKNIKYLNKLKGSEAYLWIISLDLPFYVLLKDWESFCVQEEMNMGIKSGFLKLMGVRNFPGFSMNHECWLKKEFCIKGGKAKSALSHRYNVYSAVWKLLL